MRDQHYQWQEWWPLSRHPSQMASIEISTQGTIIGKKESTTSTCYPAAFAWCGGVVRWRLGGWHGCKQWRTDKFITVVVMFMVVVNFLWCLWTCYLEIAWCTFMTPKNGHYHATTWGCLHGITLLEFVLVSNWRSTFECQVGESINYSFLFSIWHIVQDSL